LILTSSSPSLKLISVAECVRLKGESSLVQMSHGTAGMCTSIIFLLLRFARQTQKRHTKSGTWNARSLAIMACLRSQILHLATASTTSASYAMQRQDLLAENHMQSARNR
jgi:hypothetical protein